MVKKLIILLLSLLPLASPAQMLSGEWYLYPTYVDEPPTLIETGSGKLYYISGTSLFSYDRNTNESYGYTRRNLLSDSEVSNIFYNYSGKYLVVVYSNSNIDLLYDDNTVVNMSDIKDAVMMTDKDIYDVAFYDDKIYVGTSFGLVIFDEKKHCVIESGNYGFIVSGLMIHQGHIILHIGSTATGSRAYRWAPVSGSHVDYSVFKRFSETDDCSKILVPGDDEYIYIVSNSALYKLVFDYDKLTFTRDLVASGAVATNAFLNSDGGVTVLCNDNGTRHFNVVKNGSVVNKVYKVNNEYSRYTSYCSTTHYWAFSRANGIAYNDYSDSGCVPTIGPFRPTAANVAKVGHFVLGPDKTQIYSSAAAVNHIKNTDSGHGDGYYDVGYLNIFVNGELTSATPQDVEVLTARQLTQQNGYGLKYLMAPADVAPDRFDTNTFFWGTGSEGVYKFVDGVQVAHYNETNSPMKVREGTTEYWGGIMAQSAAVDRGGNLWVMSAGYPNYSGVDMMILPYAKTKLNNNVTEADWINLKNDSRYSTIVNNFMNIGGVFFRDTEVVVCEKSNCIIFMMGYESTRLLVYDTKGTFDNFTDDTWTIWTEITDQDGKSFSFEHCMGIAEDADGAIWIGGNATGVLKIEDPTAMANSSTYTAKRVKVPRNDGTDYADYLLDTEYILGISVDPSNRKWFATQNSGLYLVSADGSEIIDQFTTENSYLPDNQINCVLADPLSNKVYAGTSHGLAVYNSSSTPAQADYSDVYAYPNPVRPEYTGWITINGLMEDSYIKICDAMGNVMRSDLSQGGMYMWDGCDTAGNRVRTGVYYVFASQKAESGASGKPVTKILVVN